MTPKERVANMIGEMRRMGHLPALERNVAEICRLAQSSETQTADLTAIVMRDAALTSNILSVANSAAYRPRDPIKTISSAVIMLGFEKVRALALGLALFRQSRESARGRELYRLYTCAYFSGSVAMALARQARHPNPEEAFVAGLLHQLPRMLLANSFPEQYAELDKLVNKDRLAPDRACERVFGLTFTDITHGIAEFWNIPESIKSTFTQVDCGVASTISLVNLAAIIADMLFGNAPSCAEAMGRAEKKMKEMLKVEDFPLCRFLIFCVEADDNISRFFNLSRSDIEMMYKIAEWGKVSSAEIAANLTMGPAFHEAVELPADPRILIGHFLAELMVQVRRKARINDVLMIAQEAIYRCLNPSCVFTAFVDARRLNVVGRLYAGHALGIQAGEYRFNLMDREALAVKCMETGQAGQGRAKTDRILPQSDIIQKLKLEYALIAPVCVRGRAIAQYFVGRSSNQEFTPDEQMWLEAIAGHVAIAVEQETAPPPAGQPTA